MVCFLVRDFVCFLLWWCVLQIGQIIIVTIIGWWVCCYFTLVYLLENVVEDLNRGSVEVAEPDMPERPRILRSYPLSASLLDDRSTGWPREAENPRRNGWYGNDLSLQLFCALQSVDDAGRQKELADCWFIRIIPRPHCMQHKFCRHVSRASPPTATYWHLTVGLDVLITFLLYAIATSGPYRPCYSSTKQQPRISRIRHRI